MLHSWLDKQASGHWLETWLTETDIEPNRLQPRAALNCGVGIGAIRVVDGLEGGSETEPEGAERGEDDEGEGVTEDPLFDVRGVWVKKGWVISTSPIPPRTMSMPPAK